MVGEAYLFAANVLREVMINTRIEADQSKTNDGKKASYGFSHPKRYGEFTKSKNGVACGSVRSVQVRGVSVAAH